MKKYFDTIVLVVAFFSCEKVEKPLLIERDFNLNLDTI